MAHIAAIPFGARMKAGSMLYFGQSGELSSPRHFGEAPLAARGSPTQAGVRENTDPPITLVITGD